MDNIYKLLASIQDKKTPAALISVIGTKGSTPRAVGAKMIVISDGTVHGSIGGSAVEALIIQEAMECISSGSYKKVMHNLNDLEKHDTGMICGGKMEFFIEPINLTPQLFIFGGGHCGYPLARIAHQVGFQYTIIEDRTEYAKEDRFPDAKEIMIGNVEQIAKNLDTSERDFMAIVTRNHEMDYQTLRQIIKKPARYIGLIGSKSKKSQIFKKLEKDGFTQQDISQIHAPIGLDIGAETPEEIAISILAEMILVKNRSLGQKEKSHS